MLTYSEGLGSISENRYRVPVLVVPVPVLTHVLLLTVQYVFLLTVQSVTESLQK
jgi:hypothetical protein